MKNVFRLGQIILSVLFLIVSHSCQKEGDEIKIKKDKVSGYVQKGPYINGTAIQMYELNSSLNQTGKVFGTQIVNNKGSFEINDIALTSQFVEFSANGYYFNEVTGDISPSQLSLYALSDITDISTVNVNILTHLEKSRVSFLVGQGEDFSVAKGTAQKEILAIFGLALDEMVNSETLDISLNTEGNAILLAISIILQGNRSVGDLTELLANITTDIQQDGKLNDATTIPKLRNTTLVLDLAKIRSNLETRYQNLGISATIPGFEKYINDFLSFTALEPATSTQTATDETTTGATLKGVVNANDLSTVVTFEYGTTDAYGSSIAASPSPITGHINTSVSASLTGLNPGTQYHFRVKSANSLGTVHGNDLTFITLGQPPTVITQDATEITYESAKLNCLVNANDLSTTVIFEYGTTNTYGSNKSATPGTITGGSDTPVDASVTDLTYGTTYHYRIVATNTLGTTLSDDKIFKTIDWTPGMTVTDYDNNTYNTVLIGEQVWIAENLRTTKFNDGTNINLETDLTNWYLLSSPGYCWYKNDPATYKSLYGALYNYYAVSTYKLCPLGWHVPSDTEWGILISFLGGDGGLLKESGTTHWESPNTGATNITGFSALPGGYGDYGGTYGMGKYGSWWSSTELKRWLIYYNGTELIREGAFNSLGSSVRCIKDN